MRQPGGGGLVRGTAACLPACCLHQRCALQHAEDWLYSRHAPLQLCLHRCRSGAGRERCVGNPSVLCPPTAHAYRIKGLWGLGAVAKKLAKKSLEDSFADMPGIMSK